MTDAGVKRYWFTFDGLDYPTPLKLGCGVSAFDRDDAIKLIGEVILPDHKLAKIRSVTENVDIRTLDDKHVRPNMGNVTRRGIWFPVNYADSYV